MDVIYLKAFRAALNLPLKRDLGHFSCCNHPILIVKAAAKAFRIRPENS